MVDSANGSDSMGRAIDTMDDMAMDPKGPRDRGHMYMAVLRSINASPLLRDKDSGSQSPLTL